METENLVNVGTVVNVTGNQYPDNSQQPFALGRHGDLAVSEVHGKYYSAAKRGNLFIGSSLIAGVALPVNATTLVSKFTLWNPLGSNKDVELVEFGIGIDSGTEVINGLAVGFQRQVSVAGVPTSLTAAAGGQVNPYTGASSLANLYSAATLTNAAVLGPLMGMGINFDATTVGMRGMGTYAFDGKIVVPPDTLVTFVSTVAAITAAFCSIVWTEWNI